MEREYNFFIKRLEKERVKKNIKFEQLASSSFITKSYLSKIINFKYKIDHELIQLLLKNVGLSYYPNHQKASEYEKLLDDLYTSVVFYKPNESHEIYQQIRCAEEYFLNSALIFKYKLYEYMWLSSCNAATEVVLDKEKFIELNFITENYFDNQELQIYYDTKACFSRNRGDLSQAKRFFEKALTCGIYKYSYSMTCYHYGITLNKTNNLLDAMHYNNLAFEGFAKESNIVRQLFTQVHIAIVYGRCGEYQKAESIYYELLRNSEYQLNQHQFRNTVITNMSWLYITQKKFKEALELICMKSEIEYTDFDYFHLTYCYYEADDFDLLNKTIKKAKIVVNKESKVYNLINILDFIIETNDGDKIIKKLEEEYCQIQTTADFEIKQFYLNLIIEFCESKLKYKKALDYYKML
ncbi:helix-turn-helix transcriptional regulator [Anaerorhabdus sp.]|uniref:helix-turn-helix transcriptional regulator n=1 Tax=Anaerorhabdus sp. TaxID=1872524 RepID=UPI002FC79769